MWATPRIFKENDFSHRAVPAGLLGKTFGMGPIPQVPYFPDFSILRLVLILRRMKKLGVLGAGTKNRCG